MIILQDGEQKKLTVEELEQYAYELQARLFCLYEFADTKPLQKEQCKKYLLRDIIDTPSMKEYIYSEGGLKDFFLGRVRRQVIDMEIRRKEQVIEYLHKYYRTEDKTILKEGNARAGVSVWLFHTMFCLKYYMREDGELNPATMPSRNVILKLLYEMDYVKDKGFPVYEEFPDRPCQCILKLFPKEEYLKEIDSYLREHERKIAIFFSRRLKD